MSNIQRNKYFANPRLSLLYRNHNKVMNESLVELECALIVFPLICPLVLSDGIFVQQENAWMTTFGMDFVMESLMGDRPNDLERVPHYFVVISERDD